MDDRRTLKLSLCRGETRQFLLDPGSTVLLLVGEAELHGPPEWLAEAMVRPRWRLGAEQIWQAERGGWIELAALSALQVLVIPPDGVAWWRRVGRCLDAVFGVSQPG